MPIHELWNGLGGWKYVAVVECRKRYFVKAQLFIFCIADINSRRIYLDTFFGIYVLYADENCLIIMQVAFLRDDDGHDRDPSSKDREILQFDEADLDRQSTQWLHRRVELLQDVGRHSDAIALEDEFVLG